MSAPTVYERARRRYRPKLVKVLFVAEAPPSDPRRFFYFERVSGHDWLFLALMRWLYDDARACETRELRESKREFLLRFQADGYYLLDARETPMPPRASPPVKRRLLTESMPALMKKLRRVCSPETRIVLISSAVYRVCCVPLRSARFNVINTETIDFPSTGRQLYFARKLGRLLDERLREAISDLEASVRFWSPGKENQKIRERYVTEHFLRAIGIEFEPSDLLQPEDDPPDVAFRGAAFELKEVQDRGRSRHTEYKRQLDKALHAERLGDLLETFQSESIPIGAVCQRLMQETQALTARKYASVALRRRLDLLFYVNFSVDRAWSIEDGVWPDIGPLKSEEWRSVSFFHDSGACGVLVARDDAPAFLRAKVGRIIRAVAAE